MGNRIKSILYIYIWSGFQVIPGRMTLLITVFLVLINIFNTIQTNSPKVSNAIILRKFDFENGNLHMNKQINTKEVSKRLCHHRRLLDIYLSGL